MTGPATAWMTALPEHSGRSPPAAASAGPMYSDAANVNEARKALWNKAFRASYVAVVASRLL